MVVADNHVNALRPCIFYLFNSLDAAVQGNYETEPVVRRPVNALCGDSVALVIPVRNVEINFPGNLAEK